MQYRDLDIVEHELAEARQGRFHWEPLMFHVAGIPSYLLVAELAVNRVLHGTLPRPVYPEALRVAAPPIWQALKQAIAEAEELFRDGSINPQY